VPAAGGEEDDGEDDGDPDDDGDVEVDLDGDLDDDDRAFADDLTTSGDESGLAFGPSVGDADAPGTGTGLPPGDDRAPGGPVLDEVPKPPPPSVTVEAWAR
jgi:hypothetical protein